MRILLILFLLIAFRREDAISQASNKKAASSNRATPSKNEIQSQMNGVTDELKKQIADLKKQLKEITDPQEKESLQEQITMLEKQLTMMGGLNKNLSAMSDKTIQQGLEEDAESSVPKIDVIRINLLPKKVLTNAELFLFIKNVQAGVEKIIPAAERTEALNIYNETKAQYQTSSIVANAGTGLWLLGHWEKALFLMGKVCMDDMHNADNLNNYAAFLIMTGAEQAAVPVLEYLNAKYPNNSTILNNIGQAWFGLGDMNNAKKYLNATIELYPNHSMANSTMGHISLAGPNPDTPSAINFLKASLKGGYDPEKELELERLGYAVKFADLPAFNYPMKPDPFGLIPLLNSWPQQIQSNIDDPAPAYELQRYMNGVEEFKGEILDENVRLEKDLAEQGKKIATDKTYNQEYSEPHNCPAHILAVRLRYLLEVEERIHNGSAMPSQFLIPYFLPTTKSEEMPLPIEVILMECKKLWYEEVEKPISELSFSAAYKNKKPTDCKQVDAEWNAYYAKRADIYHRGVDRIKQEFIKKSKQLKAWILLNLYATPDYRPKKSLDYAYTLTDYLGNTIAKERMQNMHYDATLNFIEIGKKYVERLRSNCDQSGVPDSKQPAKDLKGFKIKKVECEYVKKVITPYLYRFELRCNTMYEEANPKTKKKLPDIPKGAAEIANPGIQTLGPVSSRGPQVSYEGMKVEFDRPLCLESKDASQCTFEFDKWGKLIACNFQLNEDGTALKDPDSVESGVDSRWGWNAIASSKKSYLNKLIIK